MQYISVALLLLSVIAVAVSAGNKAAYLDHVNRLKNFCCGTPKPRVFELEDVVDKETLDDLTKRNLRDTIRPAVTVLRRCESTGYCDEPNERCVATAKTNVTLTFRYIDRSMRYLVVKAENHTKCGCEKMKPNSIK